MRRVYEWGGEMGKRREVKGRGGGRRTWAIYRICSAQRGDDNI